jgi:hypothetical protein
MNISMALFSLASMAGKCAFHKGLFTMGDDGAAEARTCWKILAGVNSKGV